MNEALKCAVCGVGLTVADADLAVATDAGPVHRECFEGPVPPGSTGSEAIADAEEEAARREHNDVPLPPDGPDAVFEDAAGDRWAIDFKLKGELDDADGEDQAARYEAMMGKFPCTPHSVAGPRPMTDEEYADAQARGHIVHDKIAASVMERPDYDRADVEMERMERDERAYGGRYDEDGRGY